MGLCHVGPCFLIRWSCIGEGLPITGYPSRFILAKRSLEKKLLKNIYSPLIQFSIQNFADFVRFAGFVAFVDYGDFVDLFYFVHFLDMGNI